MGNKICFAVPTFPGHYLYALNFMKSFSEYRYDQQADLFFIFTSPEERDGFMPCNSIVLPKSLRIMKNRGIINIKKFYALMQLKDEYEYIIVIDDECLFCRTVDLYEICRSFFERKMLYGNIVEDAPWDFPHIVPECCKKFFDRETQKKLDCPLYLWFNQIPIYKASTLKDFFKTTDMGHRIHQLTFTDFDYYVYMFYLIAQCNFNVQDIGVTACCSATEVVWNLSYSIREPIEIEHIYFATKYAKDNLNLKNVFILCHCDRGTIEQKRKSRLNILIEMFLDYRKIKKYIS